MAVTFRDTDSTYSLLTISGNIAYPENNPELPRQSLGRSLGGAHFVFIRSDQDAKRLVLKFRRMSQTEKNNFTTFIQDHVNYMERTFTYTDPHSVAHTNMRFLSFGKWFFRDRTSNLWNIDLTCEEDEGL